jgi:tetratricopeptide (TPR) repeat protein
MNVLPPGTRLGSYETVTFPVVRDLCVEYTCLDHARGRPALLKAIRPELHPGESAFEAFRKIGAYWQSLGAHPHIVRCLEMVELENPAGAYLALQAVVPEKEHETALLTEWLQPGRPLPILQALLFALQIVRGMRHAAAVSPCFLHGDLKPQNILVGGGRLAQADLNRLRVTGFGLAALLRSDGLEEEAVQKPQNAEVGRLQRIQGAVGTPLYMAPELWRNERAGAPADIYALGCVLYIMLAGRHPVGGETAEALRQNHCTGNLRPLPGPLPDAARDLAARCLAADPAERYQTWEELEGVIAAAYQDAVDQPVPAEETVDEPTPSERLLEGWFLNAMGCAVIEAGTRDGPVACLELARQAGAAEGDRKLEGHALDHLGLASLRRGDPRGALERSEKALAMAREIGDLALEGSAMNNMANAQLALGDPRRAVELLEQTLATARKIKNQHFEISALNNLGSIFHNLGDLARSSRYFEQQLDLARRTGDRRGQAAALANLATNHSALGDDRRAIPMLEQSLAIKTELGDRHGGLIDLTNLANAFRNLGQFQRALREYAGALEIARVLGDRRLEASILNNTGSALSGQGDLEKALADHEQALAVFREIGDLRNQGDCLTNMGVVHIMRDDSARALECWKQALAIDRRVGDQLGLALDSYNIGKLLAQQKRFPEALPYAEEAAQILERIGHPIKAPEARQLAMNIKSQLDAGTAGRIDFADAPPRSAQEQIARFRNDNPQLAARMSDNDILETFRQADQAIENDRPMMFVSFPPKKEETAVRVSDLENCTPDEIAGKARDFISKGRLQHGEEIVQLLMKKAEQASDIRSRSLALMLQGEICFHRGDQRHALEMLGQASTLAKRTGDRKLAAQIYNSMGMAHQWGGNHAEAGNWYRLAASTSRKIGDDQGAACYQMNLGNAYGNQKEFGKAEKAFRGALDSSIRTGAGSVAAGVYGKIGEVYRRKGLLPAAYKMALKGLYLSIRLGEVLSGAEACEVLASIRIDQGNLPRAIRKYQKAIRFYQQLGLERAVAQKYADIAKLFTRMGEPAQALMNYDGSLAYYQRLGELDEAAKIHFNMGRLYRDQGKMTRAREEFETARKVFQSIGDSESAGRVARQI